LQATRPCSVVHATITVINGQQVEIWQCQKSQH
jgi:hypothetical protein